MQLLPEFLSHVLICRDTLVFQQELIFHFFYEHQKLMQLIYVYRRQSFIIPPSQVRDIKIFQYEDILILLFQ